ncbi:hypothetical protein D3C85_1035090 [compost metagenome]
MKWHKDWKRILKTYSFIGMIANLFVAISVSGLAVLGLLSAELAFPVLATLGITLGVIGLLGRFVDQEIEDIEDEDNR